MNVFPDTECYYVTFLPGTSGNFLYTLLQLNINPNYKYTISTHGNAHEEHSLFEKNLYTVPYTEPFKINQSYVQDVPSQYLVKDPLDPEKPVLYKDHRTPDFSLFNKKFPKGKIIIIQYDASDREHISCNSFYKIFIDEWQSGWGGLVNHMWEEVSRTFFNGEPTPLSVTDDQIIKYIQKQSEFICLEYPFSTGTVDVSEPAYFGQVITHPFKDLIFDKQKTLALIESVTGRTLNQSVIDCYDKYVKVNFMILNKFPNLFQSRYQQLCLK